MDDEAVAQFLAAPKTLVGTLEWVEQRNGTQVGTVVVAIEAISVGQVLAVILPVRERRWTFKLTSGPHKTLEWHFVPEGEPRRHRNRKPIPEGFPAVDRAQEHEHLWVAGQKLSRPVLGLASATHREVFQAFCVRANITPGDSYTQPSEVQLTLRP